MSKDWQSAENEGPLGPQLDALLRSYREACPDPEAGADFMPELWRRIEARRGVPVVFRRLTQRFVTLAAALCLIMMVYLAYPRPQISPVYTATYVDVLAEDSVPDNPAYLEAIHYETGRENGLR